MSERRDFDPPAAAIVRSVALGRGRTVTPDDINYILWEHTGFPGFFVGDPVTECARQVGEFFDWEDA